jgi:hypothetical protein
MQQVMDNRAGAAIAASKRGSELGCEGLFLNSIHVLRVQSDRLRNLVCVIKSCDIVVPDTKLCRETLGSRQREEAIHKTPHKASTPDAPPTKPGTSRISVTSFAEWVS